MVIVIFLIAFILGGIFLNYKLTRNKGAKHKSRMEGFQIKNEIENSKVIIYYEMSYIREKLSTKKYSKIIEHFGKNSLLERIWHNDSPEKEEESTGKYIIGKILLGKSDEIYLEKSHKSPLEAIKKAIGTKGGKITIILKREIFITSGDYTKKITFYPHVLLVYTKGNKDVFSPDNETIEKIEVFENE